MRFTACGQLAECWDDENVLTFVCSEDVGQLDGWLQLPQSALNLPRISWVDDGRLATRGVNYDLTHHSTATRQDIPHARGELLLFPSQC